MIPGWQKEREEEKTRVLGLEVQPNAGYVVLQRRRPCRRLRLRFLTRMQRGELSYSQVILYDCGTQLFGGVWNYSSPEAGR